MSWCAAYGCHNDGKKNKDKSFFTLPKEPKLRATWIKAINRTTLPSRVYLCSDHFTEECFDASWKLQVDLFYKDRAVKRKLLPGSIPTIFPQKSQPKERTSSITRALKKEKRQVCSWLYYDSSTSFSSNCLYAKLLENPPLMVWFQSKNKLTLPCSQDFC